MLLLLFLLNTLKSMWQKYDENDIGLKYVHSLYFIDYQIFINKLLKQLKPKTVKKLIMIYK